jgi:hypothetical protein
MILLSEGFSKDRCFPTCNIELIQFNRKGLQRMPG